MPLSGLLDLPWWGYVVIALAFTHITIVAVTLYLHRCQAHRGLELHPVVSHFFRLWLWLATGMVTKEWAAVHRKHHAKRETPEDPHSPQVHGIWKVLFGGVFLYVKESGNAATLERYGHGTPDDWIERKLYTPFASWGVAVMAVIDIALFGLGIGLAIWAVQMLWIPFWAAGVINGVAHYWGYRNFSVEDASTNISPWGILIGGEELHNNHHAFPTSARFSIKWYEFDVGWLYIRILQTFGLAQVRHTAPIPKVDLAKRVPDLQTVQAVVRNRYFVMAQYTQALREVMSAEVARLKPLATSAHNAGEATQRLWQNVSQWSKGHIWDVKAGRPMAVDEAATVSPILGKIYAMQKELATLWSRSTTSADEMVAHLRQWCQQAESSGIPALQEFSRRLVRMA